MLAQQSASSSLLLHKTPYDRYLTGLFYIAAAYIENVTRISVFRKKMDVGAPTSSRDNHFNRAAATASSFGVTFCEGRLGWSEGGWKTGSGALLYLDLDAAVAAVALGAPGGLVHLLALLARPPDQGPEPATATETNESVRIRLNSYRGYRSDERTRRNYEGPCLIGAPKNFERNLHADPANVSVVKLIRSGEGGERVACRGL